MGACQRLKRVATTNGEYVTPRVPPAGQLRMRWLVSYTLAEVGLGHLIQEAPGSAHRCAVERPAAPTITFETPCTLAQLSEASIRKLAPNVDS